MDTTTIANTLLNVVHDVLFGIAGFYLGIAFHSWRVQKCIKDNEEYEKETEEKD